MLNDIISTKKNQWLQSSDCAITGLIGHIKRADKLRTPQIEAIETYLFLKIAGENKPLWQLFSEGFFNESQNSTVLNLKPNALALYQFAKRQKLAKLADLILEHPSTLDYDTIIKSLFYNVSYPDYLLSLPMGAGKTYLMAAFMYLDLYFAQLEPDNKHFAHNFLVLIPSGLKSSIVPSLKTIKHFEPSWVLPEPAASHLKSLLKFDVLDESKSAKKSNKANNPNAKKVNDCFADPFGNVFVVNAEKVILSRVDLNPTLSTVEKTDDDKSRFANELRHLIGEIPNLSILIDEVHHAATDDIKLRRVVTDWHAGGNITTVLGFSGTPYLQKADTINIASVNLKLTEISNTVYYYPLKKAVNSFLKKPLIHTVDKLNRLEIIKRGVELFDERYKNHVYANGTIPKVAIYCPSIEVLHDEVLPFLLTDLAISQDEILEFHGGNKNYSLPKENELAFRSLNLPSSKHRYILLVQIGKEGWDCPSLTGVILSQKGDSPQNMVLQTACRCLRQVDFGKHETALIVLNQENHDTLDKQLQQEQHTSIEDLNDFRNDKPTTVKRFERLNQVNLPAIDFYQLNIEYQTIYAETVPNTSEKLSALRSNLGTFQTVGISYDNNSFEAERENLNTIAQSGNEIAQYFQWLFHIARASFSTLSVQELREFDGDLKAIFESVTFEQNEQRFFNTRYDLSKVESQIRLSFAAKRNYETRYDHVKESAQLLKITTIPDALNDEKLYPENAAFILDADKNAPLDVDLKNVQMTYEEFKKLEAIPADVKRKNHSFHYLPYHFDSGFELDVFKNALGLLDNFQDLEIYYNGERGLTGFVINCATRKGKNLEKIGKYTPDFLILQRGADKQIHKMLIIETKGEVYADKFKSRRAFMKSDFLDENQKQFGYAKFDFLYLEDSKGLNENTAELNAKINQFFTEVL
ncbi:MAG: DEAD/DEAH box helicase family protein [Methylococcaceae bacterium]